MKKQLKLAVERYENYLRLPQRFFKYVDIDNSSGKWAAWLDDPKDDGEFCVSLVETSNSAEQCFQKLERLYDDQLKTPKKLKNTNIVIFDESLQFEIDKIDEVFHTMKYNLTRDNIKIALSLFHAHNINFELLLDYYRESENDSYEWSFSDLDDILGTLTYISDRWKCYQRVLYIKYFCDYKSVVI